jgi:hypothetical protein
LFNQQRLPPLPFFGAITTFFLSMETPAGSA